MKQRLNPSDTNEDETTNDDKIIQTVDQNNPIRRAKLPNLEETINEDNYNRLPPQQKQTFLWKAKDKRKHKDYKWDTVYNTEGRLAREQINLTLLEKPETQNLLKSFLENLLPMK